MEILSPAGSFEALCAAVHSGADAVYVGGARFSARKNAQNFTDEELLRAVDFCHVRGVSVYVCCNTLMKDSELSEAMDFIHYAYEIGVDAIIIQDLGLLGLIRRELPDMPVHASTQMTVVNSEGVQLLSELGVKRVVLAREVTGAALKEIAKKTETELEYFVHGALCISYSGQCLMSSLLGGRSGNRGGCAQPCRLPYTLLKDGKPITDHLPLLCPKDLCLADRVQELKDMGIASLKIEGRMKSPEYVGVVTKVYGQAATSGVSDEEIQDMLKFFSRGGSCSGYFDGCTYGNMMDPLGQTKISQNLPALSQEKKRVPVTMSFVGKLGEAMTLTMIDKAGCKVTVSGEICQAAHTRPTAKERVEEQLAKLGETPFFAENMDIVLSDGVMIPISALNALRRQAADELEEKIVTSFRRRKVVAGNRTVSFSVKEKEPELCVEVMTEEQLKAAVSMGIKRIYLPEKLKKFAKEIEEPVLMLGPLSKEGEPAEKLEINDVCVQNIGQLPGMEGHRITAGHRLNITNGETAQMLSRWGVSRTVVSPELNLKAIHALRAHTDMELEVIAYGRLPLMLLENCIIKSNGACGCDSGVFALKDRKNEIFPLVPTRCGNLIYNGKPIYMADRISDIKNLQIDSIRLCFTLENYDKCCIMIREYQAALAGKKVSPPAGDFTRGHFYRGML